MASRDMKKVKNDGEEAEDRLSDLPDCLLLHILTFLPETKYSVQTSVLSKRWKYLWTSLPDLTFGSRGYVPSLKKVVRKVLTGRENNLPLRKLSFSYPGYDKSLVTRVINYAVSHNVQHFSIRLERPAPLRILFPIFHRCLSLKTLELRYLRGLFLLRDIRITTLTTLHISVCQFYCSDFVTDEAVDLDPFVGLVNLETLRVECRWLGAAVKSFTISGPKLRSLIVIVESTAKFFKISAPLLDSLIIYRYCLASKNGVEILAPKLNSFRFRDLSTRPILEFSNLDFPLLEIADVDVSVRSHQKERYHSDIINMFKGLYHAECLYLSSRAVEFLMKFPKRLEDEDSPLARLETLRVLSNCNLLSIPDTLMNYFVRGSSFGRNISFVIEERDS